MAKFKDATGKTIELTEFLSYNDIILRPQYSEIKSRNDPNIFTTFGEIGLSCPIISSPMDCVTNANLARELRNCGGLPIFHRFFDNIDQEINEYSVYKKHTDSPLIVSVGLIDGKESRTRLERLFGLEPDGYCIDIANGYNKYIVETIKLLQTTNKPIIAGSVATENGARFLRDLGIKYLRVGIGGGSACTTRTTTGVGIPNVNAILECIPYIKEYGIKIIADGGISTPGDYAKAIALGADYVMLGRVLAATHESVAKYSSNSSEYKLYHGQSSQKFQLQHGLYRDNISPEGDNFEIKVKGSVKDVVNYFNGGLRSSMSYCGANTIKEFQEKAIFHIVSHNAYVEGTAHGKNS